ncbi:hypothetical protein [Petrotoga olearia]|uniref:Uncharacterized protein n=2 Tax=Petrotoga olearia TaxID=156203 RepID=A0A2K1P5N5_9BACT|nr:hypothetical protein [Petrotoga olearia]PNR98091.1 hypothetical protein X929_00535 [Petrotoga olearia DSM 13574]RMA75470.1 hypothetical protein C8D75_0470 [Petrotoga olearia]
MKNKLIRGRKKHNVGKLFNIILFENFNIVYKIGKFFVKKDESIILVIGRSRGNKGEDGDVEKRFLLRK